MTSLKSLSNQELIANLKKLVGEERKITLEVLKHLKEVEARRLFLQLGYSSLFKYVVKELSYSEDEAYRRINAMRLLRDMPSVETKIETGTLNLTSAAKIQGYFKTEKKQSFSSETKMSLIESLESKSTREVQKELVRLNPNLEIKEQVKVISADKVELKLVLDEDLLSKLDQLKNLLSHKNPSMNYQELIQCLAEMALDKLDPARQIGRQCRKQKPHSVQENEVQRNVSGSARKTASSRYIPVQVKRNVWKRDRGTCTYVDPKTKTKCDSRHLLQFDHVTPFSLGGAASEENLRLLCAGHNQHRARQTFGEFG